MIEVEMTKDLRDFSPKVIAFLDRRQLICVAIGCAYSIPIGRVIPLPTELSGSGSMNDITARIALIVLLMSPAIACGWVKMYGMPLEVFVIHCILPILTRPATRLYRTETVMDEYSPDPAETYSTEAIQEKEKKMNRAQKRAEQNKRAKYGAVPSMQRWA